MSNQKLPHDHGCIPRGLQVGMPKGERFELAAEVFKMMSDGTRIQVFWLLCHCEECVVNISALLDMSSPAVFHHLKLLKTSGLVVSRREGKEVYYTAAKTPRAQALHEMIERIQELSCPGEEDVANPVDSNVRTVNRVHDFLIQNMQTRFSIEELALKFHINQTTLKTTFKTVFGKPIAAYMKEYRIKQAKELLIHSEDSIAQIAQAVGYENQSKFTRAFKEEAGVLPSVYRKNK